MNGNSECWTAKEQQQDATSSFIVKIWSEDKQLYIKLYLRSHKNMRK